MLWIWIAGLASAAPFVDFLASELTQSIDRIVPGGDPVHYAALAVTRKDEWDLTAADGTVSRQRRPRQSTLDVEVRIGTPDLDSTRPLRGFSSYEGSSRKTKALPIDGDSETALRTAIWSALDHEVRGARQRMIMIRSEQEVKVEEEVQAPDFEVRDGATGTVEVLDVAFDEGRWSQVLIDLSDLAISSPNVHWGAVGIRIERVQTTFVDTEGAKLDHGRVLARLNLDLSTVADDGDRVQVYRAFDVHDPARFPEPETLRGWVREAVDHL
jgi:TldD protein